MNPTLIGVPLAWADDGDVPPAGLLVVGVVEALWLLEEQPANVRAPARIPAIQGDRLSLEDLERSFSHSGRLVAILLSCLIGISLPGKTVIRTSPSSPRGPVTSAATGGAGMLITIATCLDGRYHHPYVSKSHLAPLRHRAKTPLKTSLAIAEHTPEALSSTCYA
jgi:hypothetical protein